MTYLQITPEMVAAAKSAKEYPASRTFRFVRHLAEAIVAQSEPAVVSPAQATKPVVERHTPPMSINDTRAPMNAHGECDDEDCQLCHHVEALRLTAERPAGEAKCERCGYPVNPTGSEQTHRLCDCPKPEAPSAGEDQTKCCPSCGSTDPRFCSDREYDKDDVEPCSDDFHAASAGANQQGEGDVTTENVQAVRGVDGGRLIDFMDAQLAAEKDIRANVDRSIARQRELHGALIASINVAHAEEVKALKANIDRWGETYETLRQEYRSVVKERDDIRANLARQAEAHARERKALTGSLTAAREEAKEQSLACDEWGRRFTEQGRELAELRRRYDEMNDGWNATANASGKKHEEQRQEITDLKARLPQQSDKEGTTP